MKTNSVCVRASACVCVCVCVRDTVCICVRARVAKPKKRRKFYSFERSPRELRTCIKMNFCTVVLMRGVMYCRTIKGRSNLDLEINLTLRSFFEVI